MTNDQSYQAMAIVLHLDRSKSQTNWYNFDTEKIYLSSSWSTSVLFVQDMEAQQLKAAQECQY